MKHARGAQSAINSCWSIGRSSAVIESAPYLMKLPAIQWYSPCVAILPTLSPQSLRQPAAPPLPDEQMNPAAILSSNAIATNDALPYLETPSIATFVASN